MPPGLSALAPRAAGVVGFGGLDDVGGRRFGGIRRVFGKASDLFGEFGHLLAKFSVFVFGFCDPSLIKLFFDRFHQSLHIWLMVLLSDTRGHQPESEKSETVFANQNGACIL